VGIVTIIVGSLGLLSYCLCSIRVIAMLSPRPNNPWAAMHEIPGYVPMAIILLTLNILLSSLFLAGGIGMLLLGSWARILTLICAFTNLTTHLANIVYTFAVVNPHLARMPRNLFRELSLFGENDDAVFAFGVGAMEIFFSVVTIIVLMLPSVAEAFTMAARRPYRHGYPGVPEEYAPRRRSRYDEDW
jgi:hypothetical protein